MSTASIVFDPIVGFMPYKHEPVGKIVISGPCFLGGGRALPQIFWSSDDRTKEIERLQIDHQFTNSQVPVESNQKVVQAKMHILNL